MNHNILIQEDKSQRWVICTKLFSVMFRSGRSPSLPPDLILMVRLMVRDGPRDGLR